MLASIQSRRLFEKIRYLGHMPMEADRIRLRDLSKPPSCVITSDGIDFRRIMVKNAIDVFITITLSMFGSRQETMVNLYNAPLSNPISLSGSIFHPTSPGPQETERQRRFRNEFAENDSRFFSSIQTENATNHERVISSCERFYFANERRKTSQH